MFIRIFSEGDDMIEELKEQDISEKFLTETDPRELQSIVDLFNLNMKKKNMLRTTRISEIQDGIVNQIFQRVSSRPDEFSNSDLINYFKVMQETLLKNPTEAELPQIHINQSNQVNINVDNQGLDRMSRERVANAIRNILNQTKEELISTDESGIIDVEPENIESEDIPFELQHEE